MEWKYLIFSMEGWNGRKYGELKMLQLQNTRGQLLILGKIECISGACSHSCRAFTAAGTGDLWCLESVSFGDGVRGIRLLLTCRLLLWTIFIEMKTYLCFLTEMILLLLSSFHVWILSIFVSSFIVF